MPDFEGDFLPLSRFALLQRLGAENVERLRLQRLLALWLHHRFRQRFNEVMRCYLPFSPDRDTETVLQFTTAECNQLQEQLLLQVRQFLAQANYREISAEDLDRIFSAASPHGLELKVDLSEFDEILLFSRGDITSTNTLRDWKTLFLKKRDVPVALYQRLFILLKLKPEQIRIDEICATEKISRKKAEEKLKRYRANLPNEIGAEHIVVKLFKNIPQVDLEMLFPNTEIKLKQFDKLKLGVTAGGGTVGSVTATATKLAAAANPLTAAAALAGLAGVIFRQVQKFLGQRTRYMMLLAQRLYFHNLANNRAALTLLADRAEEEIYKNALLAWHILDTGGTFDSADALRQAVEKMLSSEFGVHIRFDIEAALATLDQAGLITRAPLKAIPMEEAQRILETNLQRQLSDSIDQQEQATLTTEA